MYRPITTDFNHQINVWRDREFNMVPTGLVAQAHRAAEEGLVMGDGTRCDEVLELIGSPERECPHCGHRAELNEFKFNLGELEGTEESDAEALDDDNRERVCPECDEVITEGELGLAYPNYAYPAAWGWMAQPNHDEWYREHAAEVAELGFYVYDGSFGILLGIDAGGFDFQEAFWAPLYRLRFGLPPWVGRALEPSDGGLISWSVETMFGWKLLGCLRVVAYDRLEGEITFRGDDGRPYQLAVKELPHWVPVTEAEFAENGYTLDYREGDVLERFPDAFHAEMCYVVSVDENVPHRVATASEPGTLDELRAKGVDWVVTTRDNLVKEGWYADSRKREAA